MIGSGSSVLTVFDVGARGGIHERWRGLPVRAIGFDPDKCECDRLNALQTEVRYLPYALGAEDGATGTLHFTSGKGCTSLFRPNTELIASYWQRKYWEVVGEEPITLTTLDSVCAREGVRPHVLKMDIQGSELDALRGAENVLTTLLAVEAEVSFRELYIGAPLFADVDVFLRSRGFSIVQLRTEGWRQDRSQYTSPHGDTLMWGDALYFHEDRLRDAPDLAETIFAAYRLHDRMIRPPSTSLWRRFIGKVLWEIAVRRGANGNFPYDWWLSALRGIADPNIRDWRGPGL